MKRAIEEVRLPQGQFEFSIEIRKPGIIRNFIMAYAQKKTLIAMGGQTQPVVEEIPMLFVEVDPDEAVEERRFVVVQHGKAVESDMKLIYRGTTQTQMGQGPLFHLFEEEALDLIMSSE